MSSDCRTYPVTNLGKMGKEAELLKAIKKNNQEKIMKLLNCSQDVSTNRSYRQIEVDVNHHENETGYTPLILSVLNGDAKLVAILIANDAHINAVDDQMNTALHYAAFKERSDIADILLRHNADSGRANKDGNTPLHIVCQGQTTKKLVLVLKLIQNANQIMQKNTEGYTPLDIAVMYNRKDAVAAMLENSPSGHDMSLALVEASIRGYMDIAELLLNYGASPNFINLVKGTAPLHEALRYYRYDTVKLLVNFGADLSLRNAQGETPIQILGKFPEGLKEKFSQLIVKSKSDKRTPSYVGEEGEKLPKSTPIKEYPLIDTEPWWTQNAPEYCNSSTAKNPNTNLLDGDLCTFWVMPTVTHAWTVLDLQDEYLVTGLRIIGWNSPQMVKTIELQKGPKLNGPWTSVGTFKCTSAGSSLVSDPGVPQDFLGLNDTARFWKLLIYDNHGGKCMCFQGVGLFGADRRVIDICHSVKADAYTDALIQQNFHMFRKFVQLSQVDLIKLFMEEKLIQTLLKTLAYHKLTVFPLKNLMWVTHPVTSWTTDKVIPEVIVGANPCVTENLEIRVRGCPLEGTIESRLESHGERMQSLAVFNDVRFPRAGEFTIEVRSKHFQEIFLLSRKTITIKEKTKDTDEIAAAFDDIQSMLMNL